jgi:hypothetical protein
MTRSSSLWTNINPPTSSANLGAFKGEGIPFAQKGKLAVAAAMAAAAAGVSTDTPTNKKPHPVPGDKEANGKMLPNSMRKKNCVNCGGNNHWVVNFPDLTAAQCEELAGMVHISLGDNEFKGIKFLQNELSNPLVIATCKTLNPQRLYLDSTSSFYQVFMDKHLDNLRLARATLCADCNADTNFATKKDWYCNLCDLWLVRNGIANLLSLSQLEADGFTVSYHTGGNWIVTTPQGKEITFHCEENGMCRRFPFIDMHSTNAVAMVQTVRQRYEGYTKRKVQDAIAARKAQAMIGHPTDAQFLEMVRSNTIINCPIEPAHIANALTIFGPSAAGCAERLFAASRSK